MRMHKIDQSKQIAPSRSAALRGRAMFTRRIIINPNQFQKIRPRLILKQVSTNQIRRITDKYTKEAYEIRQ